MAEAFFVAGHAANACVKAQGVTVSSEDSLFPKANLQNGKPWEPFRFGSLDVNPKIEFDCNIMSNGGFEADANGTSPPTNWKIPTGGGSPTVTTAVFNEGAKSLELNATNEAAYQDREVRPGGTYRISCDLRGDGTNIVSAYVQDLLTGKWLQSGGTWTTTKTAWVTRSTATFATSLLTFTLEAVPSGHIGPAKIRILFDRPGTITAAAYVDAVWMWPKITCAALLYDTIPTGFLVAVQSDDQPSFPSPTANGNLPSNRFRRYLTFAGPGTLERYWRFLITGNVYDEFKPWVGQAVLGERTVFTTNQKYGLVTARRMPKSGTSELPTSIAAAPRYRLDMEWASNYTSYQQVADEMLAQSTYGDEPILVSPQITRPEFVYGRGARVSELDAAWELNDFLNYSLSLEDDPYPVVTK